MIDRIADRFFVGTEVERTPAFGKKTLFVVGIQDASEVLDLANEKQVGNIYFGANQSFPKLAFDDAESWEEWEDMIDFCLTNFKGYCTLDLDVACVEGLLESGMIEHNRFVPMISVKLPYIEQLNYNTTIKIDDKDFDKSNPGVWCHSLQDLTKKSAFTPWIDYNDDKPL